MGVSLLRRSPLEQLSPKKNEYSVILSFKHDRQNKVSNLVQSFCPLNFQDFKAILGGKKKHYRE